jgi:competence ComEA-like helix-hairpin-helix protein
MKVLILLAGVLALPALATVNVNTAQQSELQRTKGLDRYKAKAIIDYRNQNGPIDGFEELAKVIGQDTTDKVKTEVAFAGDPYVPPPKPAKKGAEKSAPRKPS